MNNTMNQERFDQKRKILAAHQETQAHHATVLDGLQESFVFDQIVLGS
jgi:hypothetical protein